MKRPEMECQACGGSGKQSLSDELFSTFQAIGHGATAETILKKLTDEVGTTAINNRLERLRAAGFLTRTKIGKFWRYSKAFVKQPIGMAPAKKTNL